MKLKQIVEILEAEVLTEYEDEMDIEIGCSSDLMSDILAFVEPGVLLLTSLTNIQVINTANMADIKAVCFVMGKTPSEIVVNAAKRTEIILMKTKLTTFECCGKLYNSGLESCGYSTFDDVSSYII